MRKYIITTLAIIFAANSQTVLFAKDSSKKEGANIAFEQFLNEKKLSAKYFSNLLSDTSSIALEKVLLSPTQRAYNDLTKSLSGANKAQTFQENINKVNKKSAEDSAYGQSLPEAYYKIYLDIVRNPNISPDFNLTKAELTKVINIYENKIVSALENTYSFKIEKNQNKNLTLSDYLNRVVNQNIALLEQYSKANPNIKLYNCEEELTKEPIKGNNDWESGFLHQKMLIEVAALRVIEANLRVAKAGITYDLALFDIISISRATANATQVSFNNGALNFTLPQEAYLYVPFGVLKLVSRDSKFMTALQEIEKKKQNPSYDFAKKNKRNRDYVVPQPSVYDSPYGAGSIK